MEQKQQEKKKKIDWDAVLKTLIATVGWAGVAEAFVYVLGGTIGKCIENRSKTNNYIRRRKADYQDMVRRDEYKRRYKNNE